jgi:hypothetical protein
MQKGENIVSTALAAAVLLAVLAIQSNWNRGSLEDVASSAKDFILTSAGIDGQVPDVVGYERIQSYRLGDYRAGLYRASPAPLVFAPGRFVIYSRANRPVFKLDTLEGSKDLWSSLFDFNGRNGLTIRGNRAHPAYIRDLTGKGLSDVIVGQYSGGDHCCTVATILELGKDSVTRIGRIDGIDGLPFEGLEVRKLEKRADWQYVVHRPIVTSCGGHFDAADVLAVYAFTANGVQDQTANFGDFLQLVLRQNLAKWRQGKNRNMDLLQTVAVNFAAVGQKDVGKRFFALNLGQLMPGLESRDVDPNTCLDALERLVDRVPVAIH